MAWHGWGPQSTVACPRVARPQGKMSSKAPKRRRQGQWAAAEGGSEGRMLRNVQQTPLACHCPPRAAHCPACPMSHSHARHLPEVRHASARTTTRRRMKRRDAILRARDSHKRPGQAKKKQVTWWGRQPKPHPDTSVPLPGQMHGLLAQWRTLGGFAPLHKRGVAGAERQGTRWPLQGGPPVAQAAPPPALA